MRYGLSVTRKWDALETAIFLVALTHRRDSGIGFIRYDSTVQYGRNDAIKKSELRYSERPICG